jgi:hypothetical protein
MGSLKLSGANKRFGFERINANMSNFSGGWGNKIQPKSAHDLSVPRRPTANEAACIIRGEACWNNQRKIS